MTDAIYRFIRYYTFDSSLGAELDGWGWDSDMLETETGHTLFEGLKDNYLNSDPQHGQLSDAIEAAGYEDGDEITVIYDTRGAGFVRVLARDEDEDAIKLDRDEELRYGTVSVIVEDDCVNFLNRHNYDARMDAFVARAQEIIDDNYLNVEVEPETKIWEAVIDDADADDREAVDAAIAELEKLFRELVNEAADKYYLTNTKKSLEELDKNGYLSYERHNWADGIDVGRYESLAEADDCATDMAARVLSAEEAESEAEEA